MKTGQELACLVLRQQGALGLAFLGCRGELGPEQVSRGSDKRSWSDSSTHTHTHTLCH